MFFNEEDLYYEEDDIERVVLNDNLNVSELKWGFHRILNWIGWFHESIGNNIYNKKRLTKSKKKSTTSIEIFVKNHYINFINKTYS